ncbi:MAG: flagellar hook assembly protein FlgD [Candidatus Latescibacteria bacterium]|nr:flagellar hook assembly protein FlgD [Candidatus Latescibacterota bacterium]
MIAPTSSTSTQDTTKPKGQDLGQVLGKDEFLKLLLTQVKNQDPLNPLEDKEFVAQLAQFSSLEQLQNVNSILKDSLGTNASLTRTMNTTAATALVGKNVAIRTDSIDFRGKGDVDIAYSTNTGAVRAVIQVVKDDNTIVRTIETDTPEEGSGSVRWDGRDEQGFPLPAGLYTANVAALDSSGNNVGAEAYLIGRVRGMRYRDGIPMLLMGGVEAPLSQLDQVFED